MPSAIHRDHGNFPPPYTRPSREVAPGNALIRGSSRELTAATLARNLGVTYKTGLLMFRRLRRGMKGPFVRNLFIALWIQHYPEACSWPPPRGASTNQIPVKSGENGLRPVRAGLSCLGVVRQTIRGPLAWRPDPRKDPLWSGFNDSQSLPWGRDRHPAVSGRGRLGWFVSCGRRLGNTA